jgi:hypothetical protein
MVLEKQELALLPGNLRVSHKYLGHPLVSAAEQIPVEKDQVKTGNRGPDVTAVNQTEHSQGNQQDIQYRQENNDFLVPKAKGSVEAHELLYRVQAFYAV